MMCFVPFIDRTILVCYINTFLKNISSFLLALFTGSKEGWKTSVPFWSTRLGVLPLNGWKEVRS